MPEEQKYYRVTYTWVEFIKAEDEEVAQDVAYTNMTDSLKNGSDMPYFTEEITSEEYKEVTGEE